ncbi:hypothetical protein HanRHA438_Chr17g0833861 [Helianthus annuus]|nr:hypothetical protein HanRHA438_Chr17g0833861 [Helianthus annuus]
MYTYIRGVIHNSYHIFANPRQEVNGSSKNPRLGSPLLVSVIPYLSNLLTVDVEYM